uniref:Uncharacterized protein n=1 Tax=uncultured Flavobacteriia bacterium TaxID=212695 RepID=H6REI9_9BACT|nr:hypothetical protein VIS_S3BDA80043 [uncultured Flavobacteriia bacterium]
METLESNKQTLSTSESISEHPKIRKKDISSAYLIFSLAI